MASWPKNYSQSERRQYKGDSVSFLSQERVETRCLCDNILRRDGSSERKMQWPTSKSAGLNYHRLLIGALRSPVSKFLVYRNLFVTRVPKAIKNTLDVQRVDRV